MDSLWRSVDSRWNIVEIRCFDLRKSVDVDWKFMEIFWNFIAPGRNVVESLWKSIEYVWNFVGI